MRTAAILLVVGLSSLQNPLQGSAQQPVFRVNVDLVTTDVIVRNNRDQFIADLTAGEFEVFEDGVRQDIASLVLSHGGRIYNQLAHNQLTTPAPVREGIVLPQTRPANDAAGRIFVIVIDDLHLDFQLTHHTRRLLKDALKNLIHEGDMFGIVSTGTSSISEQLTYNRQILESAIDRVQGGALKPREIIAASHGSQGPTEMRHRAQVAFTTAYELMQRLERVQNRRKAVIYISSGYDFNPFEQSRLQEQASRMHVDTADLQADPFYRTQQSSQTLSEADLIQELTELARAANRANATIYPIDPRGLSAGPDMDADVPTDEWNAHVRDSHDSLRTLADATGGFAILNTNGFEQGLKRIDNETSDYYVLGYYSKNADPLRRTRRIEVRVTRPGLNVRARTSYSMRPPGPQ
jgi:VWFA-related protein